MSHKSYLNVEWVSAAILLINAAALSGPYLAGLFTDFGYLAKK